MKIAVYCASSTKIHPDYIRVARQLGQEFARRRITLVNGAGCMGLMKASSDACLADGGEVIGVIPKFMVQQGWQHQGLTQLIVTHDMHERKQTIARINDGCIALPGGCGTLEELMEIITWKQLGLYLNPIVILNVRGFYDHLLAQLQCCVDEQFMAQPHTHLWCVAHSAEEAVERVLTTPVWDTSIRKFA